MTDEDSIRGLVTDMNGTFAYFTGHNAAEEQKETCTAGSVFDISDPTVSM